MKLLHIANGDDCYGSARCLYEILQREHNDPEIEPIVIDPFPNRMNEFCNNYNIANYAIKYYEFMYSKHDRWAFVKFPLRKIRYMDNLNASLSQIEKEIDMTDIDLVHTNNSAIDLGMRLAEKYSIPHVWHLREAGLSTFHYMPYVRDCADYMNGKDTHFIAVSNAVKREWIKVGIPEAKITVIYDGVEPVTMSYGEKNRCGAVSFVLSGSISPTKGQEKVIEAFNLMNESERKHIHVDFWGDGDKGYIAYLKRKIRAYKLEAHIDMRGFASRIWDVLKDYDVGLNCTSKEAFGRSTVEYLMAGIPVVASNTGANPEIINKSNGMLFEYRDHADLKNKMLDMAADCKKYNSSSLREEAVKKFSSMNSTNRFIDYCKTLVG